METSVFRVSEETPAAGPGASAAVWAWLGRHRRLVLCGVVLTLGSEGLLALYKAGMAWAGGDRAFALDDLRGAPMYFFAAWGVYQRPARWGWRVGMLLVWVAGGILCIGMPTVWLIWWKYPEAQSWWAGISMDRWDWLGVAFRLFGLVVFIVACLALRRLYPEAVEPGVVGGGSGRGLDTGK